MIKLSTVFKKDPKDLGRVIDEIRPENQWVLDGEGYATVKWDGTSCMIEDNVLYKRYDSKVNKKTGKRKNPPEGAIPCTPEPDPKSGHWPHWVKCSESNPADKYHFEAFYSQPFWNNGTYELIGEKVQGNPEKVEGHKLVSHGWAKANLTDRSFQGIKDFLKSADMEGIVFHHPDGRMCKIRKSDFGFKRL